MLRERAEELEVYCKAWSIRTGYLTREPGTRRVAYAVNERGQVEQAEVVRGIGYGCDEAALAWIQAVQFKPLTDQQGRPQAARFTTPILFRLR